MSAASRREGRRVATCGSAWFEALPFSKWEVSQYGYVYAGSWCPSQGNSLQDACLCGNLGMCRNLPGQGTRRKNPSLGRGELRPKDRGTAEPSGLKHLRLYAPNYIQVA